MESKNLTMVNAYGEIVPAKLKTLKGSGIFHKTTCGKWVKKVIAVREGLELTGERKRMSVPPIYIKVPA